MKEKHIVVYENTHRKVKVQALQRHMSIREYIDYLIDKDKKTIMKGE